MKKDQKIVDIFDGEFLQLWEDDGYVYVSFTMNGVTMSFPKHIWTQVKDELITIIKKEIKL